jgi:outer membrane lipoprotein-sorting protein
MLSSANWFQHSALAALLLLGASPPRVQSEPAKPIEPDEVMRRAERRFDSLSDYECIVDADTRLGDRTESGTYRLWFKAPALLRTHVLRGRNAGSEVAVDRAGTVRARKGGLLRPFVKRLSREDPRLRNLRGVALFELDWGSFYRQYRRRALGPGASSRLLAPSGGGAFYEIELTYDTPAAGTQRARHMRELYRVDAQLWVMVSGDVFEDGVRVEHVTFRDIRLNPGRDDGWFRF